MLEKLLSLLLLAAYYFPSLKKWFSKKRGVISSAWVSVLMVLVHAFFWLLVFSAVPLSNAFLASGGFLLALLGVIAHKRAVNALGDSWSEHVEFRGGQQLQTTGSYGVVRHPLYFSALLFFTGVSFANFSFQSIIALIVVVLYFKLRILVEERALKKKFGVAYEDYSKRVPAIFPKNGFAKLFVN